MDARTREAVMSELYTLPGHLLWRASALVAASTARVLPRGIDVHAYAALLALTDREPQSQQGLARLTSVSGTTMTTVAEALQRKGLVERVRNPDDRRSYSLTRTPAGRSALREWKPHVTRLEEQLTRPLSVDEKSRLHEILLHMMADQLHDDTPPKLRASTGFLITRCHQLAHREFAALLDPLKIEPRDFGVMRALMIAEPTTQGDIARVLDVSPATVVQLVDHLEAAKLVDRARDATDRRAYSLRMTSCGREVVKRSTSLAEAVVSDRIGGPRSHTRRDLVRLLRLLLTSPAQA